MAWHIANVARALRSVNEHCSNLGFRSRCVRVAESSRRKSPQRVPPAEICPVIPLSFRQGNQDKRILEVCHPNLTVICAPEISRLLALAGLRLTRVQYKLDQLVVACAEYCAKYVDVAIDESSPGTEYERLMILWAPA